MMLQRSIGKRRRAYAVVIAALACWPLVLGTPGVAVAQNTGEITEFPVPTPGGNPGDIKIGPDGGMWFTEFGGNKIGRIDPFSHAIVEFPVPTPASGPAGFIFGPDGRLWFCELLANKIGRFSPLTLTFQEFTIPTPFAQP